MAGHKPWIRLQHLTGFNNAVTDSQAEVRPKLSVMIFVCAIRLSKQSEHPVLEGHKRTSFDAHHCFRNIKAVVAKLFEGAQKVDECNDLFRNCLQVGFSKWCKVKIIYNDRI